MSNDELIVTRLEAFAQMLNHGLAPDERSSIIARVAEIKAKIEQWRAFWSRPAMTSLLPDGFVPPLIGHGTEMVQDHLEKRLALRERAEKALREIDSLSR